MVLGIERHPRSDPALIGPGDNQSLSYGELQAKVEQIGEILRSLPRTLALLVAENHPDTVVCLLACLEIGYPVALLHSNLQGLELLVRLYNPGILILPSDAPSRWGTCRADFSCANYRLWTRCEATAAHPDLALLLQTSGSTGSPRLVRLTRANLESNARSIASYLTLSASERAVQSLPLFYSYGLSLTTSHLYAGGSLAFTRHSFISPEFWQDFHERGCTSFAGVPFMYESLDRLGFEIAAHSQLLTLTQAGGALAPTVTARWEQACRPERRRFFVMYGQSEATARISYVPPAALKDKLGSIGICIEGGSLSLADSELIYSGPNVMMGYAESQSDLLLGDLCQGHLRTGDLGRVDADGFFFITGRIKRFAKLYGSSINLDEVEGWLEDRYPLSAVAFELAKRLELFVVASGALDLQKVRIALASQLGLPRRAVGIRLLDSMPLTPSGKKDRKAIVP